MIKVEQSSIGDVIEYSIYDDRKQMYTYSTAEIGELLGYNADGILCVKDGIYSVHSFGGDIVRKFFKYANAYPRNIKVPVCKTVCWFRADTEEEEIKCRNVIRQLQSIRKDTMEEVIEELLSLLSEKGISCPELELYRQHNKDLSKFLKCCLTEYDDLQLDIDAKLCRLAFRLCSKCCND